MRIAFYAKRAPASGLEALRTLVTSIATVPYTRTAQPNPAVSTPTAIESSCCTAYEYKSLDAYFHIFPPTQITRAKESMYTAVHVDRKFGCLLCQQARGRPSIRRSYCTSMIYWFIHTFRRPVTCDMIPASLACTQPATQSISTKSCAVCGRFVYILKYGYMIHIPRDLCRGGLTSPGFNIRR